MTIKAGKNSLFIFDLDDTLYPEIDYLNSAFREIAGIYKNPDSVFILMKKWYDASADVFAGLVSNYPEAGLTKDNLLHKYRMHFPQITLNPGVAEILKSLKSHALPMALITDGRSSTQRNKIKALHIENYFSHIYISEETGANKIEGLPFIRLKELYVNADVFVFGDNIHKDFKWPKEFGWTTIGIKNQGSHIHSQEITGDACLPDHYIDSFTELKIIYE